MHLSSQQVGRRPARLLIAPIVLSLTGVVFFGAACVLAYGTLVNAPPVAELFGVVAAVLLAIAVVHLVIARGVWLRARWAVLFGIVVSIVGVAIPGYIWFDQFTHSDDALRVATPYLVAAVLYLVCLVSLLTGGYALKCR